MGSFRCPYCFDVIGVGLRSGYAYSRAHIYIFPAANLDSFADLDTHPYPHTHSYLTTHPYTHSDRDS